MKVQKKLKIHCGRTVTFFFPSKTFYQGKTEFGYEIFADLHKDCKNVLFVSASIVHDIGSCGF